MKELIESVVFAISLLGVGSYTLREVHDAVRKAAIEKIAHGLAPLPTFGKNTKAKP
jgi:hypothetical protein